MQLGQKTFFSSINHFLEGQSRCFPPPTLSRSKRNLPLCPLPAPQGDMPLLSDDFPAQFQWHLYQDCTEHPWGAGSLPGSHVHTCTYTHTHVHTHTRTRSTQSSRGNQQSAGFGWLVLLGVTSTGWWPGGSAEPWRSRAAVPRCRPLSAWAPSASRGRRRCGRCAPRRR